MLIVLAIIAIVTIAGTSKWGFDKGKCKCVRYKTIRGREKTCARCAVSFTVLSICIALLTVCFLTTVTYGIKLSGQITINQKIEMYESENIYIESEITTIVENYMRHERETFESVASENPITLIQLYPELKSDSLVERQIELYISNNEIIKALRLRKIDMSLYRWWLYFG